MRKNCPSREVVGLHLQRKQWVDRITDSAKKPTNSAEQRKAVRYPRIQAEVVQLEKTTCSRLPDP